MRILAVADIPDRLLYDNFNPDRWRSQVDLILACGDLDGSYLDFLVSVLNVPLYYVAGNHDTAFREDPPAGCENLDGRVVTVGGLRIAGIAGSMQYNAGSDEYQYTEQQMKWRMRRLCYKAWRAGGVDIVISHAAPLHCPVFTKCPTPVGVGRQCAHGEIPGHLGVCIDASDRCHMGFASFRDFILRFHPRFWLHGHNHLTYAWMPRLSAIDYTTVINAYGHYILDTEARQTVVPTTAAASTILGPSHNP